MRILPRKHAKRVVFMVRGSCIVPTMIVNRAVGRNGSDAIDGGFPDGVEVQDGYAHTTAGTGF